MPWMDEIQFAPLESHGGNHSLLVSQEKNQSQGFVVEGSQQAEPRLVFFSVPWEKDVINRSGGRRSPLKPT